jgi:hypothetical protein
VEGATAAASLRRILTGAGVFSIVHCCAPAAPLTVITAAGAGAVSLDLGLLRRDEEDALAEAVEAGLGVLAGATGTAGPGRGPGRPPAPRDVAQRVRELWHRIGQRPAAATASVVITPSCGLAGTTPAGARQILARCREAARILPELIEEGQP